MLKGFKEFILRGNVIDLAVAVVIGAAFTKIVSALVDSVLNPALGALFDAESLATAFPVTIPTTSGGEATMYFGAVLAAIIQFLLVALVVYFAIIVPINYLARITAKRRDAGEETPGAPSELDLLTDIRNLLASPSGAAPGTGEHGKHVD